MILFASVEYYYGNILCYFSALSLRPQLTYTSCKLLSGIKRLATILVVSLKLLKILNFASVNSKSASKCYVVMASACCKKTLLMGY